MIFATLIPTFIHFLAFARALTTIVLIKPLTGAAWIADGLEQGHAHKGVAVIAPSFVLTALQLVPAIGMVVLAAVFLPAISAVEAAIASCGEWLGDIAIRATRAVAP